MVARASGPVLRICSRIHSVRGVELVVGHDLAHEAHRAGVGGVDLGRGEEQEPRPGQADDVDQARRHVRVGQTAQELGHAEAGPVGRDGHVAVHARGRARRRCRRR